MAFFIYISIIVCNLYILRYPLFWVIFLLNLKKPSAFTMCFRWHNIHYSWILHIQIKHPIAIRKRYINLKHIKPYTSSGRQYSIYYKMLNRSVNFITRTYMMVLNRLNSSVRLRILWWLHIVKQFVALASQHPAWEDKVYHLARRFICNAVRSAN